MNGCYSRTPGIAHTEALREASEVGEVASSVGASDLLVASTAENVVAAIHHLEHEVSECAVGGAQGGDFLTRAHNGVQFALHNLRRQ